MARSPPDAPRAAWPGERFFFANPVPFLFVDAQDHAVVAANEAAARHYGHAVADLVGRPFAALLAEEDAAAFGRLGRSRVPEPLRTHSHWGVQRRGDGAVTAFVGPLFEVRGRPAYLLWSLPAVPDPHPSAGPHDPAALAEFAFSAFHDLKEPLQLVRGYLDLLRPSLGDDAEALDFLQTAAANTDRMQALVMNLLEYFRLESRALQTEPVDLNAVLTDALDTLRLSVAQSGATVHADALPTLLADRSQATRLFQNLLSNAIKFRGEDAPQVAVSARRDGDEWVLTVRDNGIGIPAHEVERVFTPFRRLHSIDVYPGTGLGLTTCKRIVEAHGGRIWIESDAGLGTSVHVALPAGV